MGCVAIAGSFWDLWNEGGALNKAEMEFLEIYLSFDGFWEALIRKRSTKRRKNGLFRLERDLNLKRSKKLTENLIFLDFF